MVTVNLIKSRVVRSGQWDRVFCRKCRENMVYSIESSGDLFFHTWTCVDCGEVYKFPMGERAAGAREPAQGAAQ